MLRKTYNIFKDRILNFIGDSGMKILSSREYDFLMNPKKYEGGYGRVLKHRIKKKVGDMLFVIDLVLGNDKKYVKTLYDCPNIVDFVYNEGREIDKKLKTLLIKGQIEGLKEGKIKSPIRPKDAGETCGECKYWNSGEEFGESIGINGECQVEGVLNHNQFSKDKCWLR